MIRTLFKWTAYSALTLLALVLLALGGLVYFLNTEGGTQRALQYLGAALPGQLELGTARGTLWRGLHFDHAAYSDADRRIEAGELDFSINWATLLNRRLTLNHLDAESIDYRPLNTAGPPAGPPQLNFKPPLLDFSVSRAQIGQFTYSGRGEALPISDITVTRFRSQGIMLRASRLSGATRGVSFSMSAVRMQLAGSIPLSADVSWQFAGSEWSGNGIAEGSLAAISFDQAVQGPFPGRVDGTLTLPGNADPRVDARVRWSRWIIDAAEITDGDLHIQGWLDGYEASNATMTLAVAGQVASASVSAAGNLERLDWFTARLESADGVADIDGTLRIAPEFDAAAAVSATGTLGGFDWRAMGNVEASQAGLVCRECGVFVGDNIVRFSGNVVAGIAALDLLADVPQPQQFAPSVSGHLRGRGTLSGPVGDPLLSLTLSGQQLHVGADAVPVFDLQADSTLRRSDAGIFARVTSATITEPLTGEWQLDKPLDIEAGPGKLRLEEHAWHGTNGILHVSGIEVSDTSLRFAADIASLPLEFANAWLPADLRLQGQAQAEADLALRDGLWSGSAAWHQADSVLRATRPGGETTDVTIRRVDIQLQLTDSRLSGTAELAVDPGVTGQVRLELDTLQPDAQLRGELRFSGDDWDWVPSLVPEVDRIDGAIMAEVGARGPLNAPEFSGNIAWRNGALQIPVLNVPFNDIDVVISGGSAGTATIKGTASASGGNIAIEGVLRNVMRSGRALDLRFTGNNAELVNWPEYRIWATPDLAVVADAAGWRFSGQVKLPRADIQLRELPASAVEVSPDTVILGDTVETAPPTRITGDTTLVLGDRVRVNALGLDTGLTGELQLRLRADRDPEAVGRVTLVDGVFAARGQQLTIRQGELTFTGPLNDPLVDVRAVRVIQTIDGQVTAGIHLTGRATNLTSTVFSEPAMADSDALSYLVVGRPLNQATEAEGGDISGAAVALGIKQAARIVEQVGQSLGLDQLSLTGDGGDSTALVAGKQINRRIYARYAYGIFTRLGALLVRYRLTDRLTLEAGTGETQSIDVLYSIETD